MTDDEVIDIPVKMYKMIRNDLMKHTNAESETVGSYD